jgi:hypothetical protein
MCTDLVFAGMYAIHFGNTYYKAILVLALLTDLPKVGMLFFAQTCHIRYASIRITQTHGVLTAHSWAKCQNPAKNAIQKIREIYRSYLCLHQFEKILLRSVCNNWIRKSRESVEICLEVILFWAGFSYF